VLRLDAPTSAALRELAQRVGIPAPGA
jgi:hypothetical protein